MRSLSLPFFAAMLASPIAALDICRALHCYEDSEAPSAWITLKAPIKGPFNEPTIRIDLDESDHVCDPSAVKVFMQPLPIDKDGRGEGSLMITPEVWIKASWEMSCSTPKDSSKEHKLRFAIHAINDEKVHDTEFVTRFREMYPVVFTSVESKSLAKAPEFSRGTIHYVPEGDPRYGTLEEL